MKHESALRAPARRDRLEHEVEAAATAVGLALTAAVVVHELRVPRDQRTWHGRLGGLLPYDLRLPTLARVRRSLWAPEDEHLFLPRAFGIGWSVNVPVLLRLACRVTRRLTRSTGPTPAAP